MQRALTSNKPYLIRALHEWMSDNGLTPQIIVDAAFEGLNLPSEHVSDGKLVLNISYSAARYLKLDNGLFTFDVRFGGVARRLEIPPAAVLGIYARETGQGMVFADGEPPPSDGGSPSEASGRPKLSVVK
jgi:stringent starvation protein B